MICYNKDFTRWSKESRCESILWLNTPEAHFDVSFMKFMAKTLNGVCF